VAAALGRNAPLEPVDSPDGPNGRAPAATVGWHWELGAAALLKAVGFSSCNPADALVSVYTLPVLEYVYLPTALKK